MGYTQSDKVVSRRFINNSKDESSIAAVSIDSSHHSYDDGKSWGFDGTIRISDCSRMIELDFSCDKDEVLNKIEKASILEQKFKEMRESLENFKSKISNEG